MTALSPSEIRRLVRMPAIVTLGVTLLRFVGELMHWSERFFSRAAGGGGAIVGIGWLMPVFGIYFARKLVRRGHRPQSAGRAVGLACLGLGVVVALGFAAGALGSSPTAQIFWVSIAAVIGAAIAYRGWRELGQTLLAYGLAARIPVAAIMLVAILASFGTHYELGRPDMAPIESPLLRWIVIGLVPQMGFWIPATIIFGSIAGAIAAAVLPKRA